jgi:hypothetical protein
MFCIILFEAPVNGLLNGPPEGLDWMTNTTDKSSFAQPRKALETKLSSRSRLDLARVYKLLSISSLSQKVTLANLFMALQTN